MPVETRLFDISLAPGLQASVTITTPDGSSARAENAMCYYRGDSSDSAVCVISADIRLLPQGPPEVPAAAPPVLLGALALAALGATWFQRS